MRIMVRHTPFLLFLLSSLATSHSTNPQPRDVSIDKFIQNTRHLKDSLPLAVVGGKSAPIGTEHAPVDGRDGMPHDGPFVETGAERSRKKQLSDDTETVPEKPIKKEQYSKGDIPQSNDAVMDDRHSSKPAEGTRGTEGGISGKGKPGFLSDKKPDPPKDARPHSQEQEEVKTPTAEDPKSILKVTPTLITSIFTLTDKFPRPPLICPRNHTIFLTLRIHPRPKIMLSSRTQTLEKDPSTTNMSQPLFSRFIPYYSPSL